MKVFPQRVSQRGFSPVLILVSVALGIAAMIGVVYFIQNKLFNFSSAETPTPPVLVPKISTPSAQVKTASPSAAPKTPAPLPPPPAPSPVRNLTTPPGVFAATRSRADGKALILDLSSADFSKIASVSYTLTYNSLGGARSVQGVMAAPLAATDYNEASRLVIRRELVYGTCSGGVCRYDSGIASLLLVIIAKFLDSSIADQVLRISL